MGGQFLKVPYEEDGAGQGGYAKEMSDEYKAAEQVSMRRPSNRSNRAQNLKKKHWPPRLPETTRVDARRRLGTASLRTGDADGRGREG